MAVINGENLDFWPVLLRHFWLFHLRLDDVQDDSNTVFVGFSDEADVSIGGEGTDDTETLVWGFWVLECGKVWLTSYVKLHWLLSRWNIVIFDNFILLSILRGHICCFLRMMQVITLWCINSFVRWWFSPRSPMISHPPEPWFAGLYPLEASCRSFLSLRKLMSPVTSRAKGSITRSLLTAVCLDPFLWGFSVCRSSCLVSIITTQWINTVLIPGLALLLALHNFLLGPRPDLLDLSLRWIIYVTNWRANCLATVSADSSDRCHCLKAVSGIHIRLCLHHPLSRGWD